jgi:hypothetical protein
MMIQNALNAGAMSLPRFVMAHQRRRDHEPDVAVNGGEDVRAEFEMIHGPEMEPPDRFIVVGRIKKPVLERFQVGFHTAQNGMPAASMSTISPGSTASSRRPNSLILMSVWYSSVSTVPVKPGV